jgi:glycosyltransferase involved in cell wall biosynthesis
MDGTEKVTIRAGIDMRLHAYAPGGISRYSRRLARAICSFFTPGALRLIHHYRDRTRLNLPGASSFTALTPPHHRLERWSLGAEIYPCKLDIFHATDFIPPAWGARYMVITIHDLNFLYYPQYLTDSARRYYNDQINWAVKRADAIIVDSNATREDLRSKLHVPEELMTVVHLAADSRFRQLDEAEVSPTLDRYALAAGYVLFVGTWEPRKNLVGLLDALAQLNARGDNKNLVIAGRPGWLYEDIYQHIEVLNLEDKVRFIKQPTPDQLIALYNGASVLVMPSFYEGFGLPALESMQCGTPVIVSNRGSLPEVVGHAGLLVDPEDTASLADAMRHIMHDESLRETLRKQGFARSKFFSWEATARKTLQVYKNVIQDAEG